MDEIGKVIVQCGFNDFVLKCFLGGPPRVGGCGFEPQLQRRTYIVYLLAT